MSRNLEFNTSAFNHLIKKYGLRGAWINILATHILNSGEKFAYILEDEVFSKSIILENDLLDNLTIGKIGILYEYCVAENNIGSRKNNGQFFTPDDVAKLMVEHSIDFPKGKWLDPCSGIGNLSWHLVNFQKNKEDFLLNRLILSDKDDLALLVARVLFTISFQKKDKNLYFSIGNNFKQFDFLSVAYSNKPSLFEENDLQKIPIHDFVIVNPPYLSIKGEDSRFQTSKSRDLYAYFLENIIKTSKGFISVTPQSFTNAAKFGELRDLLLKNYHSLRIYCFDNIPGNIFHGIKFGSVNSNSSNSIRAAIMIARPGKGSHEITSLLRWKTSEREAFFGSLEDFLSSPKLSVDFFPKVSSKFVSLYRETWKLPNLSSIMSAKKTSYALHIPSAPRYFISALKEPVSRASIKVIYFDSEKDLNRAYLILNSSFMYWWWRVRDGGMTLSLETISSLPLPNFNVNKKLVSELEKSEKVNKVYKKNAGAMQENVKHSKDLIFKITTLVIPKYAAELIEVHGNSDLS